MLFDALGGGLHILRPVLHSTPRIVQAVAKRGPCAPRRGKVATFQQSGDRAVSFEQDKAASGGGDAVHSLRHESTDKT
jgi:hypothetical protein